jgi:O-antigen ligase
VRSTLPHPLEAAPLRAGRAAGPAQARAGGQRETWDTLLIAISIFIATAVGRAHQLFPILSVFKPVMISGGVAVILAVLATHRSRTLARSWTPALTWLSCFMMWSIFSIPGSLWPGGSFSVVFDDFIKTALVVVVVVLAIRSRGDVERLMLAYFASAALYAAVVFVRMPGGGGRIQSFYMYDANDYAAYAVTAIPLGLYFLRRGHSTLLRLAALGGTSLLMLTFLRGQSRGGFLALVGCALAMLIFYRSVSLGKRVLITAVSVAVFMSLAGPQYLARIETIWKGEEDYNRTSETGRLEVWKRGIGYMVARPVFGVGAGQFGTAEGRLSPHASRQTYGMGVKWGVAHNTYIQIGAELGVPGILFFLLFLYATLRRLLPIVYGQGNSARSPPGQAQTLLASMGGFLIGAMFLSLAYYPMFYILAAMAMGMTKGGSDEAAQQRPTPRVRHGRRQVALP